jgi:hypothetical protein
MKRYLSGESVNTVMLLALLFFCQFLFPAGEPALGPYKDWMVYLRETGLSTIFERVSDQYGPGTYLVLTLVNWLTDTVPLPMFQAYKYVQFGFVVVTLLVAAAISGSLVRAQLLILLLAVNSVYFPSIDILYTPFSIYALWALSRRQHMGFAAAFLAGCLCKYQPLIFAPILAACLLRRLIVAWKASPAQAARLLGALALPTVALLGLSFIIFGITWPLSGVRALEPYAAAMSAFSFNLHWLLGFVLQAADGRLATTNGVVVIQSTTDLDVTVSRIVLFATMLWLAVLYWRRPDTPRNLFVFSAAVYLAYYIIPATVFANHLQGALAPLFLLATDRPGRAWLTFWGMVLSMSLILFIVWPHPRVWWGLDISVIFSLISVGAFGLYIARVCLARETPASEIGDQDAPSPSRPLPLPQG